MGALHRRDITHPSLYLIQGDRLRCQAQRGYWQVLDGIPVSAGVIGRTVRSGTTVVVEDAAADPEFLAAAPNLVHEVCVPIRRDGVVVGALNVESTRSPADDLVGRVEEAAAIFAERLRELGGVPEETVGQRVARLVVRIAQLETETDIVVDGAAAASQLTAIPTAAIALADNGAVAITHARGPLADALTRMSSDDLATLTDWVSAGSSLYSTGTANSELGVHRRLHTAGIASLLIVPLNALGGRLGILLLASDESTGIDTRFVSGMEILGTQIAAGLRTARAVTELRDRSMRDPLTGLGHHTTFHDALEDELESDDGRHVAVLIIDVDEFKQVNDHHGHLHGDELLRRLSAVLADALRTDDLLYRIGGDEFATAIRVASHDEAAAIARRLISAAHHDELSTVSVGVALAEPGMSAETLLKRADEAMYRAKESGGDDFRTAD